MLDPARDHRRQESLASKRRRRVAAGLAWTAIALVAIPVGYVTYRLIQFEGGRGMDGTFAMNIIVLPPLFVLLFGHPPLSAWIERMLARRAMASDG
jgi:hypothetical protein